MGIKERERGKDGQRSIYRDVYYLRQAIVKSIVSLRVWMMCLSLSVFVCEYLYAYGLKNDNEKMSGC